MILHDAFGGDPPNGCTITDEITLRGLGSPLAYNCIGWSLCSRIFRWVWLPAELDTTGTPNAKKMEWFDNLYKQSGWVVAASCAPEKGKRKIARYCDGLPKGTMPGS